MTRREEKAALRQETLAHRDSLDPETRIKYSLDAADHGAGAFDFEPGTIISGFFPIRSEIDARPLMDILRRRGATLCLPVILDKTTIVFRELTREDGLVSTGFGTVGPGPEARVLDPQIMIMPLAVFDGHGNRIGYGAGHYDRAVSRLAARSALPKRIGLAFSLQRVAQVPAEPHDWRMEAVITEAGAEWFSDQGH